MLNPKIKLFSLLFFLFNYHLALGLYINSSYLKTVDSNIFSNENLGLIFGLSGLLTIIAINKIDLLFKICGGIKKSLSLILGLNFTFLFSLLFLKSFPALILIFFILYQIVNVITIYLLDLFVEEYSKDTKTGSIRGFYLTIGNSAIMIAPISTGLILGSQNNYNLAYFWALLFLITTVLIWLNQKNKTIDFQPKEKINFISKLKIFFNKNNKNISNAFLANFIMNLFFSMMVIYTPLFLNQEKGISWQIIGIIFTIMLSPFVLFELPIGKIADKTKKENIVILLGLIIISVSTIWFGVTDSNSWIILAIILFLTRTGASFIEIGSESLFFKNVDISDYGIIGFFRFARPMGFLLGPIMASIFFFVFNPSSYRPLFIFLGLLFIPIFIKIIFDSKNLLNKSTNDKLQIT